MSSSLSDSVNAILELFATRGAEAYVGEPVSQLEHALQTATYAVRYGAPDTLVVAALLHDVGHLLHGDAESGFDTRHQDAGTTWLSSLFPIMVTEPVRLHVAAKRYLCAVEPAYLGGLSPASQRSLELQGGAMTGDEVHAFERLPAWRDAVLLRRWDDQAKVPCAQVLPFAHYLPYIERVLSVVE